MHRLTSSSPDWWECWRKMDCVKRVREGERGKEREGERKIGGREADWRERGRLEGERRRKGREGREMECV